MLMSHVEYQQMRVGVLMSFRIWKLTWRRLESISATSRLPRKNTRKIALKPEAEDRKWGRYRVRCRSRVKPATAHLVTAISVFIPPRRNYTVHFVRFFAPYGERETHLRACARALAAGQTHRLAPRLKINIARTLCRFNQACPSIRCRLLVAATCMITCAAVKVLHRPLTDAELTLVCSIVRKTDARDEMNAKRGKLERIRDLRFFSSRHHNAPRASINVASSLHATALINLHDWCFFFFFFFFFLNHVFYPACSPAMLMFNFRTNVLETVRVTWACLVFIVALLQFLLFYHPSCLHGLFMLVFYFWPIISHRCPRCEFYPAKCRDA